MQCRHDWLVVKQDGDRTLGNCLTCAEYKGTKNAGPWVHDGMELYNRHEASKSWPVAESKARNHERSAKHLRCIKS